MALILKDRVQETGTANTTVSLATIPTQQSYRFLSDAMDVGANKRSR